MVNPDEPDEFEREIESLVAAKQAGQPISFATLERFFEPFEPEEPEEPRWRRRRLSLRGVKNLVLDNLGRGNLDRSKEALELLETMVLEMLGLMLKPTLQEGVGRPATEAQRGPGGVFEATLDSPIPAHVTYRLGRDKQVELLDIRLLEESEVQERAKQSISEGGAPQPEQAPADDLAEASGPSAVAERGAIRRAAVMQRLKERVQPRKSDLRAAFVETLAELAREDWATATPEECAAVVQQLNGEAAASGVRFAVRTPGGLIPVSLKYNRGVFELASSGGGYTSSSKGWPPLEVIHRTSQSGQKRPAKSKAAGGAKGPKASPAEKQPATKRRK